MECLDSVEECWATDQELGKVLQPRLSRRVFHNKELTAETLRTDKAPKAR